MLKNRRSVADRMMDMEIAECLCVDEDGNIWDSSDSVGEDYWIYRVPGGWVYRFIMLTGEGASDPCVFVPKPTSGTGLL